MLLAPAHLVPVPVDQVPLPRPQLPLALLPTSRSPPAAFSASVPSLLLSCKRWLSYTTLLSIVVHDGTRHNHAFVHSGPTRAFGATGHVVKKRRITD
jgi:hypothetical protein